MISERQLSRGFPSFWQELLPLLTPRFISLFNEAYSVDLAQGRSVPHAVDITPSIRADLVAEFAFRWAALSSEAGIPLDAMLNDKATREAALFKAQATIDRYEGRKPTPSPLSEAELLHGFAIAQNYAPLLQTFEAAPRNFCPRFNGCGFLDAAEGDLILGDTLIEIKTTTRKVASKDLRQLIVYLALNDNSAKRPIINVAVFNPRRGTLHKANADTLLLRLSGGKPRVDVLAEVVDFVQTSDHLSDRLF